MSATTDLQAAIDAAIAGLPIPRAEDRAAEPPAPAPADTRPPAVRLPQARTAEHRAVVRALPAAKREILAALLEGHTLPQIAAARGRSLETLKTQAKDLHKRFGVSTRGELLSLFLRKA